MVEEGKDKFSVAAQCSGHTEDLLGPGEWSETCTGICRFHKGPAGQ